MAPLRISSLVALALLTIGSCPRLVGNQDDVSRAQHDLLLLEQHWLESENDADKLEPILADDFVHVWPTGFVTKSEQLDFIRRHGMPLPAVHRLEDLKVRIYGTVGIVNGTVVGQETTGSPERKTLFTDVFAFRNGKWQAVNAQELLLSPPR